MRCRQGRMLCELFTKRNGRGWFNTVRARHRHPYLGCERDGVHNGDHVDQACGRLLYQFQAAEAQVRGVVVELDRRLGEFGRKRVAAILGGDEFSVVGADGVEVVEGFLDQRAAPVRSRRRSPPSRCDRCRPARSTLHRSARWQAS